MRQLALALSPDTSRAFSLALDFDLDLAGCRGMFAGSPHALGQLLVAQLVDELLGIACHLGVRMGHVAVIGHDRNVADTASLVGLGLQEQ